MRVRASARRVIGPWMDGPQGAVHAHTTEVCVLLRGELCVNLDGRPGRMRAGEVAVIPASVVHSSWTEAVEAEELVVHVEAEEAVLGGIWPGAALDGVDALLAASTSARQARAVARVLASCRELSPTRPGLDPRLRRVVLAVCAQLEGVWTIERMAGVAAMSPRSFRRQFAVGMGESPVAWVLDQRVEMAKRLLDRTDRTVSAIALDVGFRSPSRLSEAFTRRVGMAPSLWRRR